MIRTTTGCFIKLLEIVKIEIINNSINDADRIVRCYVFINSSVEKELFGWECKDENVTLP